MSLALLSIVKGINANYLEFLRSDAIIYNDVTVTSEEFLSNVIFESRFLTTEKYSKFMDKLTGKEHDRHAELSTDNIDLFSMILADRAFFKNANMLTIAGTVYLIYNDMVYDPPGIRRN
jgi:hypothetical protein